MRLEVKGHIFPKVWDIACSVKKLREERKVVNIGSGTISLPVYEVQLSEGTKKQGVYFVTPQGIRLYYHPVDQYNCGFLISDLDEDPVASKIFKKKSGTQNN